MDPTNELYSKTPLNSHNQEIRLLHILPGRADELLELGLSSVSLSANPTYAALSYCWGPQDDLQDVKIEGTPFQISHHLHGCLLSLRQPDESLSIWVDAICINQQSNQEKNTQVPLMKDIYKSAAQMFVWMGQASQGLGLIFNSIQNLAERQVPVKIESIEQVAKELLGASPEEAEQAFHEFVDLSWFRRTWIIQELALPRSGPIFVCGHRRAPWTNLKRWWLICRELNGTVTNHSAIMGTKWEKLHKTLNFPALRNLYQLRELFETESILHRGLPLSVLIVFSEESVATDPRDKIYGILGLTDANAKSKIAVDYDKPVGDLYEEVSRYLIVEEDRLSVLATALPQVQSSQFCPPYLSTW
ncbi:heterokaryon incompatibility protein [Colletotrichum camelliae]|nr:heterokaryon incompatibility protein [Colletotrichum camelliae]